MQLLLPLAFLLRTKKKKKKGESPAGGSQFSRCPFFFFLFRWVSDDIEKIKQVFFFFFLSRVLSFHTHTHTHIWNVSGAKCTRNPPWPFWPGVFYFPFGTRVCVAGRQSERKLFILQRNLKLFLFFLNPPFLWRVSGWSFYPPKKKNFYFGDKKKKKSTPRTGKEAAAIIIFFPSITTTNKKNNPFSIRLIIFLLFLS